MRRVYLDNNSTQGMDRDVLDVMLPLMEGLCGNASNTHFYGQESRTAIDHARMQVASAISCNSDEIIFTSGGTEANNLAIHGLLSARPEKKHIICSAIEHSSVLKPCRQFADKGYSLSIISPSKDGVVSVPDIENAIEPNTGLITVMYANNETGAIQPIDEIAKLAKEHSIPLHVDAVQALGKVALNARTSGIQTMSFSAHKIGGPKGVGALYLSRGTKLNPLMFGGTQERRLRPGTENVPAIAGFGKACELRSANQQAEQQYMTDLMTYFKQQIESLFPAAVNNSTAANRLPNTLNVSFPGHESETLLVKLDLKGIAVSSGSACSAGDSEPSHVLKAMGLPPEILYSCLRFSISRDTTKEELEYCLEVLKSIVN